VTITSSPPALPATVHACLFDLDGVLTSTAGLHAEAWKATFDAFLANRDPEPAEADRPFDMVTDYREYVDGRLRDEGARTFLASRHISLPEGSPEDPPGEGSVHALARSKDERFLQLIDCAWCCSPSSSPTSPSPRLGATHAPRRTSTARSCPKSTGPMGAGLSLSTGQGRAGCVLGRRWITRLTVLKELRQSRRASMTGPGS
jgi:hypothetical protein